MNHMMIAAVAAVFLLFAGFADAAGGWRNTNPCKFKHQRRGG